MHKCSFDLIHTEGTVIRDNDCIIGKTSLATLAVDQVKKVRPSCANLHYTELMAIREQIFSACVTLHEGGIINGILWCQKEIAVAVYHIKMFAWGLQPCKPH